MLARLPVWAIALVACACLAVSLPIGAAETSGGRARPKVAADSGARATRSSQPTLLRNLPVLSGGQSSSRSDAPDPNQLPRRPSAAALQRVAAPITRAIIVNSLCADQGYGDSIDELAKQVGLDAGQLGAKSISGAKARVSSAGGATSVAASFDSLDWVSGLSFTPNLGGPSYTSGGKTYRVGTVYMDGGCMPPSATLRDWTSRDVMYVMPGGSIWLFLEVPPTPAAYMFTIRLVDAEGTDLLSLVRNKPPLITAEVSDKQGYVYPNLAALSNGAGLVCVCNVVPSTSPQGSISDAWAFWGMRKASCHITFRFAKRPGAAKSVWHPLYYIYGGITVTKL